MPQTEILLSEERVFLQERASDPRPNRDRMNGTLNYGGAIGTCCNGRCFAVTVKRYMTITAPGIKEGDMVCLSMGGQVPFIIRPLPTLEDEESRQERISR